MSLFREPLLYFLVAGGVLFAWFGLISEDVQEDSARVLVDEQSFTRYLMHRNPRLDLTNARRVAAGMPEEQRDQVIDQMVREEVLYREALAIGLDTNDYASKRRLITQLDYINQAAFQDALNVSVEDVVAYFERNQDRYREPARVTFTHVFFSSERHEDPAATAMETLSSLNTARVPFHLGTSYGDHFLYHRNYVGKTHDEVASHFGTSFADEVFELPEEDQWWGPLASEYGQHLVMIGDVIPTRVPTFDEIASRVQDDLSLERVEEQRQQYYERTRARYDVEIRLDGLSESARGR